MSQQGAVCGVRRLGGLGIRQLALWNKKRGYVRLSRLVLQLHPCSETRMRSAIILIVNREIDQVLSLSGTSMPSLEYSASGGSECYGGIVVYTNGAEITVKSNLP
jgi:hypothetical protein